MIFYIFDKTYFLALKDAHRHIVGHTPQQLIAHLRTKYVTATQKQNEITILDIRMRLPFSMDDIIDYFIMNQLKLLVLMKSI